MKIEYIEHMGSDISVVNAARVSFDKESSFDENGKLLKSDEKLINYLARNNHWTPFAHAVLKVRVTVPIFVANQLKRHTVGLALNEVSRRYVDSEPEFYIPDEWRKRPDKSIKQGSSDELITDLNERMCYLIEFTPSGLIDHIDFCDETSEHRGQFLGVQSGTIVNTRDIDLLYKRTIYECVSLYNNMIESGVAPEMARMVLPQSMYTSWIWTGSVAAFVRVYRQRMDSHAQKESRMVANQLGSILEQYFPVSFKALTSLS